MPKYQYVKIDDRYYCLQQPPVILAWILFLKKSTLDLVYKPYSLAVAQKIPLLFKRKWCALKRNLFVYIYLIRYKYFQNKSESTITLPVYGQLCKAAHQGYKIFDLRRRMVTKVFDPNVDKNSFLQEINRMKIVSQLDFAPSLKRWDIERLWYEEEYVEGYLDVDHSYKPSDDSAAAAKKFRHVLTPCLETLVLHQATMTVNVTDYVHNITVNFEGSRLFRQDNLEKYRDDILEVKTFFRSTTEQLNTGHNCPVYLVFTHGDFCSANILNTEDGIKILDWEHAAYRSALFDFYSYFFYRPYRSIISVHELVLEIKETLPSFVSTLSLKSPEIAESISSQGSLYRLLYYIERIQMLVERVMTDTNSNEMQNIKIYIDLYKKYEELLG